MSELLPLETLTRDAGIRPCFDLAAPSPILGKTAFLRLPLTDGWKYEAGPAEMRAERNLILRDQMWVTRGKAQFVAVHSSGARFEISLRVKPWKSSAGSDSTRPSSKQTLHRAEDERKASNSVLGRLRLAARPGSEKRLIIRCRRTEREIEIRWSTARGTSVTKRTEAGDDLKHFIAACQCH